LIDADTSESVEDWSDEEAAQFVHRVPQILASTANPREALVELERLFAGAELGADNVCDVDKHDAHRGGRMARLPPP
jgi:hypothetical protein